MNMLNTAITGSSSQNPLLLWGEVGEWVCLCKRSYYFSDLASLRQVRRRLRFFPAIAGVQNEFLLSAF